MLFGSGRSSVQKLRCIVSQSFQVAEGPARWVLVRSYFLFCATPIICAPVICATSTQSVLIIMFFCHLIFWKKCDAMSQILFSFRSAYLYARHWFDEPIHLYVYRGIVSRTCVCNRTRWRPSIAFVRYKTILLLESKSSMTSTDTLRWETDVNDITHATRRKAKSMTFTLWSDGRWNANALTSLLLVARRFKFCTIAPLRFSRCRLHETLYAFQITIRWIKAGISCKKRAAPAVFL